MFKIQVPKVNSATYELPPAGQLYIAKVVDCTEPMEEETQWGVKTKVRFVLELNYQLKCKPDTKSTVRTNKYTVSLHEAANLRAEFLEKILGRGLTDEEVENGSETVEKIAGAYCKVLIEHSEDGKWANIAAITPCPKDEIPAEWVSNYVPLAERETPSKEQVENEMKRELDKPETKTYLATADAKKIKQQLVERFAKTR